MAFVYSPSNWPRCKNLISKSSNTLCELINQNVPVEITELIDGSFIAISSSGEISCRSETLFNNDDEIKKGRHFTFHGIKMTKIFEAYRKLPLLKKELTTILKDCVQESDYDLCLLGEFITHPTNITVSYSYGQRNLCTGSFCIFGASIKLKKKDFQCRMVIENTLKEFGLSVNNCNLKQKGPLTYEKNCDSELHINFNENLKLALSRHGLTTVPYLGQFTFKDAIEFTTKKLMSEDAHGFMFSTTDPENGAYTNYRLLGKQDARPNKKNFLLECTKKVPPGNDALVNLSKLLTKFPIKGEVNNPSELTFDQLATARRVSQSKFPYAYEFSQLPKGEIRRNDYKNKIFKSINFELNPIHKCEFLLTFEQIKCYCHSNFAPHTLEKTPVFKQEYTSQKCQSTENDLSDLFNAKISVQN